jgi:hypothetical protein
MRTIVFIASAALLLASAPAFAHGGGGGMGGMGHGNQSMPGNPTSMGKTTTSTTRMTGSSTQIQRLDKEYIRLVLLGRFLNEHGDRGAARAVEQKLAAVILKIEGLGSQPPFFVR